MFQCEVLPDLPVIFEESAPFVLVQLAKLSARVPGRTGLLGARDKLQILRIVQEERLLNRSDISCEVCKQLSRNRLIASDEARNVVETSNG